MADFGGFFKKLTPFIGTALSLGGPIGAMAGTVLNSVTGTKASSMDELSAVFAKSPDQQKFVSDMKAAEQQFALQMKQLEINSVDELEKIMADDRASARQREVMVKDKIPAILAIGVTIGFFAMLFFVCKVGVQAQSQQLADIMLGSLGTAWTGVIAYYFGSSHGSDRKTELLAGAQPQGGKIIG